MSFTLVSFHASRQKPQFLTFVKYIFDLQYDLMK